MGSCPRTLVLVRQSVVNTPKALQDNNGGCQVEGLRSRS